MERRGKWVNRQNSMKYEAVIFDLFGTLVRSFTRQEYDQVDAQMAKAVDIPFSEFWRLVGETWNDRCLGHYGSTEDNIKDICRRFGVEVDTTQITQAANYHYEFIRNAIIPERNVLEALTMLKNRGLKLGLISNCGPAVPLLWGQSPLAQLIGIPVFSCKEHVSKPSIGIYKIISHRLQVKPQKCIYVADGSNEELTNAAAKGMLPILKRTTLNDVYDKHRPEVKSWPGLAIDEIRELSDILRELEV